MQQLSNSKFILIDILEEAIGLTREDIRNKNLGLELFVKRSLPASLIGDYVTLQKTLNHILYNSVSRTSNGIVSIRIDNNTDIVPEFRDENDLAIDDPISLRFLISDTGDGMKPEELNTCIKKYSDLSIIVDNVEKLGTSLSFNMNFRVATSEKIGDVSALVDDLKYKTVATYEDKPLVDDSLALSFDSTLVSVPESSISEQIKETDVSGLPELIDLDWHVPMRLYNDPEICLITAQELYNNLESEIDDTERLFKDIDKEGGVAAYRIRVHGIKGEFSAAGSPALAYLARLLEYASRDEDIDRIKALHPVLMSELRRIMTDWVELAPKPKSKPFCSDLNRLADQIESLKAAIEIMDTDTCDELMARIDDVAYEGRTAGIIEALKEAVYNLNDIVAIKLCDKLLEEI